jgi:drug/metabolite transporter (DMT)-like permease
MWLLFALLSPFFWSIVHVLDRHCVEQIFARPWMGVITSSLASILVLVSMPFAFPFVVWELPSAEVVVLALVIGGLIQLSQVFYFQALEHSEAGIVAAYWNMTPALVPVATYFVLGKVLPGWQCIGIAILIVASVLFCLMDTSLRGGRHSFLLMLAASLLQTAALLIEKHVFDEITFFVGFLLITIGIIVSGSAPLLISRVRRVFFKNMATVRPAIPIILGIEVVNLIALFLSQRAVSLGDPSLVAAVESSIPAYTFLITLLLLAATKRRYGDKQVRHWIELKFFMVAVMVCGVWFVS